LAWRSLENSSHAGGAARLLLPSFFRRGSEGARRLFRPSELLRLAGVVVLLAAAIFFLFEWGSLPSWTEVTARATSLLDRRPWNRALANYKEQVALYHFGQAADAIRNVSLLGAYFKPAKEIAEKKAQLLVEWKNSLIDDLNRIHFSGTLTDNRGTQYTGIASATDESLSMKLPYGIARVRWEQLSPQELLAVSKSFINPRTPDAADRQWRCAAFASETGQSEAARELAEAAGGARPQYKEQIPVLFPDLPPAR
jgi:hypothetical protein